MIRAAATPIATSRSLRALHTTVWLWGLLASSIASAAPPLDLETALAMALERNRQLRVHRLRVERRQLDVNTAAQTFEWRLRPQISVSASEEGPWSMYGIQATRKFPTGMQLGLASDVQRSPEPEEWRARIRVEVTQPLFRRLAREVHLEPVTLAVERLQAQRRLQERQRATLVRQVIETYETLWRLQEEVAANSNALARSRVLAELLRLRERQGRASRLDVLRGELRLGLAQSRDEHDREAWRTAQRELADLLQLSPADDLRVLPPPVLEPELPSLATAVSVALSNRLDYAQALADLQAARRGARLSRRLVGPDLALIAAHEQAGRNPQLEEVFGFGREFWHVGVQAEFGSDRAAERAAVRAAELDAECARETVEILRQSISREVQQALGTCRRSHVDLELARHNHAIAEARTTWAHSLFTMGRCDAVTVLDAEDAFVEAQIRLFAARSERSLAVYRLLDTVGMLLEPPEDLRPPSEGSL